MKNNETGEFELVLGNRQLLSAFFIVVILFAVFFTMGYIVGRNSTPSAKMAASSEGGPPSSLTSPTPETRPQPAGGAEQPPAAAPTETPSGSGASGAAPAGAPPAETQPAASQPTTRPADAPPAAAAPAESAGNLSEPAPGQVYLQVMAVKRADAEVVARTLKEKGFTTTLTPAPDDRVRVLVGPYSNSTALGKAKAELENAGFHPFVRK